MSPSAYTREAVPHLQAHAQNLRNTRTHRPDPAAWVAQALRHPRVRHEGPQAHGHLNYNPTTRDLPTPSVSGSKSIDIGGRWYPNGLFLSLVRLELTGPNGKDLERYRTASDDQLKKSGVLYVLARPALMRIWHGLK